MKDYAIFNFSAKAGTFLIRFFDLDNKHLKQRNYSSDSFSLN